MYSMHATEAHTHNHPRYRTLHRAEGWWLQKFNLLLLKRHRVLKRWDLKNVSINVHAYARSLRMYIHIFARVIVCIQVYVHYSEILTNVYIYICIETASNVQNLNLSECIHIYLHAYVRSSRMYVHIFDSRLRVHTYLRALQVRSLRMYTHIFTSKRH